MPIHRMRIHITFSRFLILCVFSGFGLASPGRSKNVMRRSSEASVIKPKVFIIDMVRTSYMVVSDFMT